MGKKIYVGNLAFSATETTLSELFGQHGTVDSCHVILDRDTGRSRGFGFIEMSSDGEAQGAIGALNGYSIDGRELTVTEARPKEARTDGSAKRY